MVLGAFPSLGWTAQSTTPVGKYSFQALARTIVRILWVVMQPHHPQCTPGFFSTQKRDFEKAA